jgi:predicted Zn-dependent protease with MMP-like domain
LHPRLQRVVITGMDGRWHVLARGRLHHAPLAFVSVAFDVGDNNDEVPFILNVGSSNAAVVAAQDWDSKNDNSESFWVAYLLGAFQGPEDRDNDPSAESGTMGATPSDDTGGSLIYLETILDVSDERSWDASANERDTVVHEVGHAVGKRHDHPVTGWLDEPSKYTENYLQSIRMVDKPASR